MEMTATRQKKKSRNYEEEKATEEDKGIWGDTVSLIKDNAITLAILLILVGATIGVVIYRKRKSY